MQLSYHFEACHKESKKKWDDYKYLYFAGKARRLKQAKDEAQSEIDKFKQDREKQFKEYEANVSKI